MLLRDINEGETYAYIVDYGKLTRHQNAYCGNLPSAQAIEVVRKEKRLVEIRKDSCGRPKLQNQTFIVCKLFNVDPTDMLAADLDIVENKHVDLVTFDIEVDPADLIWPWEMEISQARTNAEVMRQVDHRVAYVEGIGHRVNRWLVQSEKEICTAICKRAVVEAKATHEARKGCGYVNDLTLKDRINRYAGVHLSSHASVSDLKQIAYSFLKEEAPRVRHSGVQITSKLSCPKSAGDYDHHFELGKVTSLVFVRKAEFSVSLFSTKRTCVGFKGYEEWAELHERTTSRRMQGKMTNDEYNSLRQRCASLEKQMWEEFETLTKLEKVSLLDNSLNRLKDEVEKVFGKRLPKYQSKKNWITWAADEEAQANAAR